MNRLFKGAKSFVFLTVLALVATLFPISTANAAYNLVWSDEFNGSSIDTNNWTFEIGTGSGGWGNNELEYYTNRPENARIENGNLVIEARKESYGGMNYTSARLKTQGKKSFKYGRIEARIKLPKGQGLWPAFWTLGADIGTVGWPKSGEIDIMEHVNNENNTHGYIHWDANGHASYGGPSHTIDVTQYHVYSIEWTPSAIKWFIDGVQFKEANIENNINSTEEFHKEHFILLNMAVGGNWPGSPDASTVFPAKMFVDYVRVYQDGGTPPPSGDIVSGGTYKLINVNSGKALDVASAGTAPGTNVQIWTDNGTGAQKWTIYRNADGSYKLINVNSALALDVAGSGTADGTNVQVWTDLGNGAQKWNIIQNADGSYKLINVNSGKALDVASSGTADGTNVQIWTDNGTGAQKWNLIRLQ
ncbi:MULTISPECIES: RICIN domain-containing protein [Cohnella]|jgi:beta-glucanase (GH16 family)|uniref:Beta-glucanase n=1 Tax=Cohnella sp. A01 TaxID=1071055 RepID=A0A173DRP6_9BACL|nr:RICIN domain-containing protein [Cohnella sp.]ANG57124.1 beta-glucanase [Cohnella sp. A01]REK64052.1 MAG: 1,3--beta-D-glucan 3-glucanohydrolase [Cohnella sp.]